MLDLGTLGSIGGFFLGGPGGAALGKFAGDTLARGGIDPTDFLTAMDPFSAFFGQGMGIGTYDVAAHPQVFSRDHRSGYTRDHRDGVRVRDHRDPARLADRLLRNGGFNDLDEMDALADELLQSDSREAQLAGQKLKNKVNRLVSFGLFEENRITQMFTDALSKSGYQRA